MTLDQIQSAVNNGYRVFWKNRGYEVTQDCKGQWFICYGQDCIGLTHLDGQTLNAKPQEFYVG